MSEPGWVAVGLATAVVLGACSGTGGSDQSSVAPTVPAPPPTVDPNERVLLVVNESPLAAGMDFTVSFPESTARGGFFDLQRWSGHRWQERTHILETGRETPPRAVPVGELDAIEEYGREGVGPEQLVLPEGLEPGHFRLCAAGTSREICGRFEVTAD